MLGPARRRTTQAVVVALCSIALGLTAIGQAQRPTQNPGFRATVDVIQIGVTALDHDRKPVRDLTAADFRVLEDGLERPIVGVTLMNVQASPPPRAAWMRDVSPDVESNQPADHRYFVVVIDDALSDGSQWSKQQMRNVANALIDQLDVADEAAVVFTSESWSGQSFTSNRWKLRQAVARVRPVMGGGALCAPAMGTAGALRAAAQALASVPRNRKAVLYVGADGFGLTLDPGFQARGCGVRLQADAEAAVRAAQLGNVAIYTFDTYQVPMRTMLAGGDVRVYQQPSRFLGDLAASTGGEHFTVPDDLAQHVPDVLEATSMYYLLGYEAVRTPAKGPFHSLEVKVTRPGVVVRSRATRYDPAAPESQPSPTPAVSATETGIAGFLPTSALRIEAATAAFAGSDGSGIVRVALNVELPDALRSAQRDVVDWLVRAYTIDGHAAGSVQNAGPVRLDDSGPKVRFGMDTVISLKPGRYTLRIAVHSKLADKTGSVYADVDMPDFAREPLALSGVVVTDTTGSFLAGDPLTALAPTAAREFATDDRAQIFLRVYEGGSSAPVAMTVRLINEDNAVVVNQVDHLPAAAFSHGRQANYWYRLPLSSLRPGEYWLSLEAAAGLHTARRDIRFRMRP